jgi:putative heme transporter
MGLFERVTSVNGPEQRKLWNDGFGLVATRSLQILAVLALAVVVVFAIISLPLIVIPVIIALILAAAFYPLVRLLRRAHLPSALATIIVLLLVVGVLAAVIYFITVSVQNQAGQLVDSATQGVQQLQDFATSFGIQIDEQQIQDAQQSAIDFVTSSQFGSGALAGAAAVGNFLTGAAVMVVTLFFFLKDGPTMWRFLLRPFTGSGYERADRAGHAVIKTLGDYVRGTAIVAAADSTLIGIGLVIIGVPLAPALIAIVFLTAFVPVIGATIAGLLAALVTLVTIGPVQALIVVGIVVLVNQIDGNLLQPLVQGRSLKLHPLVILLALTAGAVLAGITGALLSVPIAASAWAVVQVWDGPNTPAKFARPKQRTPHAGGTRAAAESAEK